MHTHRRVLRGAATPAMIATCTHVRALLPRFLGARITKLARTGWLGRDKCSSFCSRHTREQTIWAAGAPPRSRRRGGINRPNGWNVNEKFRSIARRRRDFWRDESR